MTNDPKAVSSTPVTIGACLWLLAAIAVSASGRLVALQPPRPQLVLVALTAGLMIAVLRAAPIRDWVATIPLRGLVGLHLTRAIAGSAFLLYLGRGQLPAAFAIPSGWGDIGVAVLAAALLFGASAEAAGGRRLFALWNLLGLIDILLVVANAARTAMADPVSMAELLRLPLSLLPTFLVPIIIVSHVVIGRRLREKD
jgi:hypothetical protein